MAELAVLGETMAALAAMRIGPLRHARSLELSIAGSESTVAVGACRLGRSAAWIGRLGADELGALVRATLRAEGVAVHAGEDPLAATGLMIKERRTADQRRVHYYRSGSAGSRLSTADLPDNVIEQAAILHTGAITLALSETAAAAVDEAVRRARAAGTLVSFGANYRAKLWAAEEFRSAVTRLLPSVDLLFASLEEAQILLGSDITEPAVLAGALLESGPHTVVLTMGADGALSAGPRGILRGTAEAVTETDPVGAGDSFVAGYLVGVLSGADEATRLAIAGRVAAFSVSAQGDWEGLPSHAEFVQSAAAPGEVSR
ncbi:sugar kinase [Kitasatospora sp. NPDC057015]|uniref:sugar kinase n=1 Tax=Kitasatospora sp. NPDC057015 TaxID=3346001 RepID=UPI00363AFAC3